MIPSPRLIAFSALIAIAISACTPPQEQTAQAQAPQPENTPYLLVLGVAQDAGYPQAGCYRPHCQRAWNNPVLKRKATSLALIDPVEQQKWLFEATPDMREQLHALQAYAPDQQFPLSGVLLTHGHMGHYTGLMHFGLEAMGTKNIPVYAMPRMQTFLTNNGPWSQLVKYRNIELRPLKDSKAQALNPQLSVTALTVPHRDEFTETVGYKITGPRKTALFIPDIDKWEKWNKDINTLIQEVDYALLDATFFADGELPNRSISEVPHPFVSESMNRFSSLSAQDKAKVYFIHFNHTNPLLIDGSPEQALVKKAGFNIASEGLLLEL